MTHEPGHSESPSRAQRYLRWKILRGREQDRSHVVAALRDPQRWSVAAGAAADLGATEAVPDLIRLLRAADPNVRCEAAKALGNLKATEATAPLREVAASDELGWVRSYAAEALAKVGDSTATPLLLRLLASDRWRDRMAAAHTLGLVGDLNADPTALDAVTAARRRDRWRWSYLLTRGAYTRAIKRLEGRRDDLTT